MSLALVIEPVALQFCVAGSNIAAEDTGVAGPSGCCVAPPIISTRPSSSFTRGPGENEGKVDGVTSIHVPAGTTVKVQGTVPHVVVDPDNVETVTLRGPSGAFAAMITNAASRESEKPAAPPP